MTITLTNVSGRCQVFVLAHETYCDARGECACEREPGRTERRLPRSLTLASGMTSAALEEAVLKVSDVLRAVRRGDLSVSTPDVSAPVPAVASSPLPAPSRQKRKRGVG